jgi:hypothetical protein
MHLCRLLATLTAQILFRERGAFVRNFPFLPNQDDLALEALFAKGGGGAGAGQACADNEK